MCVEMKGQKKINTKCFGKLPNKPAVQLHRTIDLSHGNSTKGAQATFM